jgi:diguanylate cyclase (GGDEF)-like protein
MKASHAQRQARDVIESIIQLTEQRDRRSLALRLVDSLAAMFDDVEGWLLDLPAPGSAGKPGDFVILYGKRPRLPTELIEQIQHLPEDPPGQLLKIGSRSFLLAGPNDTRQDRYERLVLAKPEWNGNDLKLVEGMVQVYRNFISVLYDSEQDTLTGLYNRRKLDAKLKDMIAAERRNRRYRDDGREDYLAMLDLDRFKRVNDGYGHLIGDEVLLCFTGILQRTLRENDMMFRYGGEEFVVLLRNMKPDDVSAVLERLRRNVDEFAFPQVGNVTVSIGYAPVDRLALPVQTIENADKALYFAKNNGRNQVQSHTQLVADGKLAGAHPEGSIELF